MSRIRSPRSRTAAGMIGLALLVSACGGAAGSPDSGSTGDDDLADMTIALVGYGNANPWGAVFNEVYADELADTGVTIQDMTTMDPGSQVQKFNQAVSQRPDLIAIAVLDTQAMVVPIQKAEQAGIPVLVFDGRPDPAVEDSVLSVLSDNVALGRFAAENIIEGLQAQGRESGNVIVLTGTASMLVTQDRMQGFHEAMSDAPQYRIIEEQDANWDPTLSGQIAQQLLAKHGCDGVQAAFGMADYMALPIVQAAKQAGCAVGGQDGLVITGGNCFKVGIEAIRAGDLYGTATEDPVTIARQTADYTVRFLTGQNPPRSETIQEERITADTVEQFAEQCSQA